MIVFELACDCGYTFEGWFQDRSDFENQQSASFLVCPECGSRNIRKILSPIRTQSVKQCEIKKQPINDKTESTQNYSETLEALEKFINENFEDVGAELATESLKIHYGVSEPRNLRGVTTEEEEKKLKEEGINLLKVPLPAKNKNVQ